MKLKIHTSTLLYIAIFASFITICNVFLLKESGFSAITSLIIQFCANILLLMVFSFNKIILKIASTLILFLTLLALFIFNQYGIIIDEMMILNTMDNLDNQEAINFFQAIPYFLTFFISLFIIIKVKITNHGYKKLLILISISSLIIAGFVIKNEKQHVKNFFASYCPFNAIAGFLQYEQRIIKIKKAKLQDINKIYNFKNQNKEQINVILVIGESARADHFSLNGYKKPTNPNLKKIKKLISFKNVEPCYNSTSYSVSCLLSYQNRKSFNDAQNNYSNIISVYKNLNFKTHWISTQSAFGTRNLILKNAIQADNLKMKSSYRNEALTHDNKMLDEFLIKDLKTTLENNQDNNFIVLHTNGSHFPLDSFISEDFIQFKPSCKKISPNSCSKEEIINAYDNTILYTDFFLAKLFKTLENTNSIVIYASDHGSFLGEGGKYFHGNKEDYVKMEHKVPMILWMSDNLLNKKKFSLFYKKASQKTNQNLSHDNIFHSLLGCSAISSDIKDNDQLNICN